MLARVLLGLAISIGAAIVVAAAVIVLAGATGLGGDRLRLEAQAALSAFAGRPIELTAGAPRLSLDGARFVSIEVPEVGLAASGREFSRAGALRLGLDPWPLLSGRLALKGFGLADASIDLSALPGEPAGGRLPAWLADERGLVDPDRVVRAAFAAARRALDALGSGSARELVLSGVTVRFAEGAFGTLLIREARLGETAGGGATLSATLEIAGRSLALGGEIRRGPGGAGAEFALRAAFPLATAEDGAVVSGEVVATLDGSAEPSGGRERIAIEVAGRDLLLPMPENGRTLAASLDLAAEIVAGSGKVEFGRIELAADRSRFAFHGALSPAPAGAPEPRAYRFEFVSDGSTVAAADAPEPALSLRARLAGQYEPGRKLLTASQIGVRTGPGELFARATLQLFPDKTPAIAFAMDVPRMPVPHAKQLWPVGAAPGARAWVLSHVFGGMVRDSRLRFKVAEGRLGNGVPLSAEEVNGRFVIDDTRFDITGELPPVRDAYGAVEFGGSDVDISLSTGVVYMPTGRTVEASNGTFVIRNVEARPLVGAMDIDVRGDAPSVVEFSSYRPIEAMRHLALQPQDFTGEVSGNVQAQIPLRRDFPIEELRWRVALDYRGLSLARPLEGQTVAAADGSILVEPERAVIKAKARLNGVDAEIALTEPLGGSKVERQRNVVMRLDDAARDRLAPGLGAIVSGPVVLTVATEPSGGQRIKADLAAATVRVPWAGWSKGAGIPATASFLMRQSGDTVRLSEFVLAGKTFGVEGELDFSGGVLAEARLSRVALNRDDDVSLAIRKSGGRYAVAVKGASLDARSIVKLYLSDAGKAGAPVEPVPISLEAEIGRLSGFGGETLSAVRLNVDGAGSEVGSLALSANARGGAAVSIRNATEQGGRKVSIKSGDAGALLRFLDIYEFMQGGTIDVSLSARGAGPLGGQIDARDFWIVDEPRLRAVIAVAPPESDGRTPAQATRAVDTSKAFFERGFAVVDKGDGYLAVDRGVLRGPVIGATFQGTLYDRKGQIAITGTFMPAYGVNRLFAEIPLFGQLLGNGRDRGLIGITFKLAGEAGKPQLQVNPISAIAPGIFRSIFEYN